jgi:anti-sigma regulatory factor (Ser/Thr protein kinase)
MSQELSLKLEPELGELARVNSAIADFVKASGLPDGLRQLLELCSEEWLVNVISYGIPEKSAELISFDLDCDGSRVALVIAHRGVEFDPLAHKASDIPMDSEERALGGLGIPLIQSLMDQVVYTKPDGRNCLRMIKYLDAGKK